MMSISALQVTRLSVKDHIVAPKDIESGEAPPRQFVDELPQDIEGTCLLADVRMYQAERGLYTALIDLGAQIPVVLKQVRIEGCMEPESRNRRNNQWIRRTPNGHDLHRPGVSDGRARPH